MQRILNIEFIITCFKYFSFRYKSIKIHKQFFKDAVYEGQGYFDEKVGRFKKHGIGILLTNKGEFFYGQFKDDRIDGEGNVIDAEGNFSRAEYKEDKLNGKCIITQADGKMYLLNFRNGLIHGYCTYFPFNSKHAYVICFKDGAFKRFVKRYSFSSEQFELAKLKVIKSVFSGSQLNEILYTDRDTSKILKKVKEDDTLFLNAMLINKTFFYCGVFDKQMQFNGLGMLIDSESKKIRIGCWENNQLNRFGFIINNKYSFHGYMQQNQFHANTIVKNTENKEYKLCWYEAGTLKKVEREGKGDCDFEFLCFKSQKEINKMGFDTEGIFFSPFDYGDRILYKAGLNGDDLKIDLEKLELRSKNKLAMRQSKANIQFKGDALCFKGIEDITANKIRSASSIIRYKKRANKSTKPYKAMRTHRHVTLKPKNEENKLIKIQIMGEQGPIEN